MKSLLARGHRVALAAAVVALSAPAAFATTEPPTMTTYSDAVDVTGLIQEGGTLLAAIVAAAVTVALAFKVVRIGLRWFRA